MLSAAASCVNIKTKVTPIWEKNKTKKSEHFNIERNSYWDVQTLLNIYEEWCNFHNIDPEEFSKKT